MISPKELGQKISGWLGDSESYGVNESERITSYQKLRTQSPFHTLLSYQTYDAERKLFLNDNSVGFGLSLTPLLGASEETVNNFSSMLNTSLPDDGDLHILCMATNKIGAFLDRFVESRSHGSEDMKRLADMRATFFNRYANEPQLKSSPGLVRDFVVSLFYSEPAHRDHHAQCLRLHSLRENIQSTLSQGSQIDVDVFLMMVSELLAPSKSTSWPDKKWSEYDRISDQVTYSNIQYKEQENHIELHEDGEASKIIQAFNVREYPTSFALWQMNDLIGHFTRPENQLSCPFVVSLHLRAEDQRKSQAKAQTQFITEDKNAHSQLARFIPAISKKHQEWTQLRETLNDSERLCAVSYHVLMISDVDKANSDKETLLRIYSSRGWRLNIDSGMQLPVLLSTCPFLVTGDLFNELNYFKEFKKMTTFNAVNLMPVMGEWKGASNLGGMLVTGRRGQIAAWNPFANTATNKNVVVSATTQAGKSTFVQDLACSVRAMSGIIRIFDLGGSYKKLCHALKGQYIEITPDFCINVFTQVKEINESMPQLSSVFGTMAHPTSDITDMEKAVLEEAIGDAYKEYGCEANVSAVIDALIKKNKPIANDLSTLLYKYSKKGHYGHFFDGKSTVDYDNPFLVFEMEKLKSSPDLKSVVTLSSMIPITEEFYGLPRNICKMCIIDEAWDLLHNSRQSAEFIAAGYRRVAKQQGSFVTIVQMLDDFFENAMAKAAYANSETKIILLQDQAVFSKIVNDGTVTFSPYELEIIKGINKNTEYSEFVLKNSAGSTLQRLVCSDTNISLRMT